MLRVYLQSLVQLYLLLDVPLSTPRKQKGQFDKCCFPSKLLKYLLCYIHVDLGTTLKKESGGSGLLWLQSTVLFLVNLLVFLSIVRLITFSALFFYEYLELLSKDYQVRIDFSLVIPVDVFDEMFFLKKIYLVSLLHCICRFLYDETLFFGQ